MSERKHRHKKSKSPRRRSPSPYRNSKSHREKGDRSESSEKAHKSKKEEKESQSKKKSESETKRKETSTEKNKEEEEKSKSKSNCVLKYLPQSEKELKAVILQYLSSEKPLLPVDPYGLSIFLRRNFKKSKGDFSTILSTNLIGFFKELEKKAAVTLDTICIGPTQSLLITQINKEKMELLNKEAVKDRPKASNNEKPKPKSPSPERNLNRDKANEQNNTTTKTKRSRKSEEVHKLLEAKGAIESKKQIENEEIEAILKAQTAQEKDNMKKSSQQQSTVRNICEYGDKEECKQKRRNSEACNNIHFKRLIMQHTDENLGDCSYLDTCRHMEQCKYVHYKLEDSDEEEEEGYLNVIFDFWDSFPDQTPPQMLQCDLRYVNFDLLGKFQVIMADPPWDIHMELPYGTMRDEEMKALKIQDLQTDGLIFLWVTGRAMEIARECLNVWGYKRVEELVWVKTNQLQRVIRTGRTGHWLNHSKEHCLIGIKGNWESVVKINRHEKLIDCDVIVSEVRQTSRKPDEIYCLIERICPGGRKIGMHLFRIIWKRLEQKTRLTYFRKLASRNLFLGRRISSKIQRSISRAQDRQG